MEDLAVVVETAEGVAGMADKTALAEVEVEVAEEEAEDHFLMALTVPTLTMPLVTTNGEH